MAGNQAFGRISQAFKTHHGAGAVSTCALTTQRDRQEEGAAAAGGKDGSVQAVKADFLRSHLAFFFFLSSEIFSFKHHKKVLDILSRMPRRESRRKASLQHGSVDN